MPLPTSGPISMSMIATEFSSSQTVNLSLIGFGAALSTPVTSNIAMSASFYGQSAATLTSFDYIAKDGTPASDGGEACELVVGGGASEVTAFHNGSGTFPTDSDNVYTNSAGTVNLENGYYKMASGTNSKGVPDDSLQSFRIISGVLSELTDCD